MMKQEELTNKLTRSLPTLLPTAFTVGSLSRQTRVNKGVGIDILATVRTPTKTFRLAIEAKNTDRLAPMREAAYQAKKYAQSTNTIPLVATWFLGERVRQAMKEEGVGYIDLAGNFYLNQPGLYTEKIVDKNPFSNTPPLKNIFASTSSRITRAMLIEPKRSWTMSELSKEAVVSIGQTYNVLEAMAGEEFVAKEKGTWKLINPAALLEAWKKVYPTYQQRSYRMYSFARDAELAKLIMQTSAEAQLPYALGFFTGADLVAPFIRGLSKIQLYTSEESIETWKRKLDLKEVDNGGNIEFYIPYDKGVFYKTQEYKRDDGVVNIVSNVQLYMDLSNNPARGEEAAEHLRESKLGY